jgi:hypothetical protein
MPPKPVRGARVQSQRHTARTLKVLPAGTDKYNVSRVGGIPRTRVATIQWHGKCTTPFNMSPRARMPRGLRAYGLSIVITLLFVGSMVGQTIAGLRAFNEEQREHGRAEVPLSGYLRSGHFLEATAENWESEFLQMMAYVILTAFLYQVGSAESKKLGEPEAVDRDPRSSKHNPSAPWPVRRGGLVLAIYENSLSLAFASLFLASFALHALGGVRARNADAAAHGSEPLSVTDFMATSQFWFESFQNWQSEFLSLVAMVVLSIFLRQRGSPESKPVDAAHSETGSS